MKLLTASSLALAVAAGGAFAQTASTQTESSMATSAEMPTSAEMAGMQGDLIRSRDITDAPVYTTSEADDEGWEFGSVRDGVSDDWNEIGEVEDLVLSRDGQITGIVAEVGGFLDIADKHVVVAVSDLNLVAVDDKTYAFVTRMSEEELESMENVDEGFWN